jgi:hypothetical protein
MPRFRHDVGLMNWYFEQQGVSHGPLPENELVLMLRRREITHETMIWHPGMERWQEIVTLKPEWLVTPSVGAAVAPVKAVEMVGVLAEKKIEKSGQRGVPASRTESTHENSGQAGKPVSQKAEPILKPFSQAEPVKEEPKPGLFKKLFGLGKKKA